VGVFKHTPLVQLLWNHNSNSNWYLGDWWET